MRIAPLSDRCLRACGSLAPPRAQVYRSEEASAARETAERAALVATLNKSRDLQMRWRPTYDIVSNAAILPDAPPPRPRPHEASRTGYNLINFVPREGDRVKPERPTPPSLAYTVTKRDYDILSNRYRRGHDSRAAGDAAAAVALAADRYWGSRSFDPVACTLLDPASEAAFGASRDAESGTAGRAQFSRLPPRVRGRAPAGEPAL